jgi:hypothetical protein
LEEAVAEPCRHSRAINLDHHLVALISRERPQQVTWACPECFEARSEGQYCGTLAAGEGAAIAELSAGCEMMRGAIETGGNLSALVDELPSPIWFPRLGLAPSIGKDLLLPHELLDEPDLLRKQIRRQFGRAELSSVATVETPVGQVKVDDVYENHFFDLDPATGKDRRDPDHVFFVPVVRETLGAPIEIWEVQDGGRSSRRLIFLKLYLLEQVFAYHLAVVTRDLRLLTAHRIHSLTACQARRKGRPRYVAY